MVENFSVWFASLNSYLPQLSVGVLILVMCFIVSSWLAGLLSAPLTRLTQSQLIKVVIRRTVRALIILLGLYGFLKLAGLTDFAVAIISGTGLIGLVVGFAFKDIAENFIASILLSIQRPFKIGDVIEAQGHIGVIKQVTARATTLVDFDGNHIQIPNATIYKNIIKNLTANPNMRGHFSVGIGYDSHVRDAHQIALACMQANEAVLDEPEPMILVESLGSSTINLTCYFWLNSHKHSVIKVASALMHSVVKAYLKHGISMPDDARERILLPADQAQVATQQSQDKADGQELSTEESADTPMDEMESEADDIRRQAAQARDPEQGRNIL